MTSEAASADRWGWVEVFIVFQTLSPALLFLPDAQAYRFAIRALPYASSALVAAIDYNQTRGRILPPGVGFLGAAMILLGLNLLHPSTVFPAGVAQFAFQLTIAAPALWVANKVGTKERLERILWLFFLTSGVSALLGLAQVFYPKIFMPEFSTLALSMNPEAVNTLTYVGASGQHIVRPPGLSDIPGGAAIGGYMAGLLGILFGSQQGQSAVRRIFCLSMAAAGLSVIYFTQIRAFLLMFIVAIIGLCIILIRQTKFVQSACIGGISAILLAATFTWTAGVGGKSVLDRFTKITDEGIFESFQQNRGLFIKSTFEDLVIEYPFGAGVGRWGMMNNYFGGDSTQAKPIWVEIQMTGWLLDGGVLMWLFYGGAVYFSLLYIYRVSISLADVHIAYLGSMILCLNLFVVGLSFAGPAFNTQLGIQYWFLTGALFGVARKILPSRSFRPSTARSSTACYKVTPS